MTPIVPAVIPKTFDEISDRCSQISSFTHELQIDIVDGNFVPFSSWPYSESSNIGDLAEITRDFLVEMDLMIQNPEDTIEEYLKAGVGRIVVHIESTEKIRDIYKLKKQYDFRLGLSLNNDTNIQKLYEVIEYADYVQVMGISEIGSQGQPFDTRVLDRIRELKEKFSRLIVSIDGSVNFETLPDIVKAGADRCAVGSALLNAEDRGEAFAEMERIFVSFHNNIE
jgi:ribulose-phosphate 3-epimerase